MCAGGCRPVPGEFVRGHREHAVLTDDGIETFLIRGSLACSCVQPSAANLPKVIEELDARQWMILTRV
jgi:hypothetical protein